MSNRAVSSFTAASPCVSDSKIARRLGSARARKIRSRAASASRIPPCISDGLWIVNVALTPGRDYSPSAGSAAGGERPAVTSAVGAMQVLRWEGLHALLTLHDVHRRRVHRGIALQRAADACAGSTGGACQRDGVDEEADRSDEQADRHC